MIICENCGENVDEILYTCLNCGNTICDICSNVCKKCHEYFCEACYIDHKKECK
ncbi:MAG: hypothetical protein ACFFBP_07905 [Promethearchaeota archaeon]